MRSTSTTSRLTGAMLVFVTILVVFAGCDSSSLVEADTSVNVNFKIASFNYEGMSSDIEITETKLLVRGITLERSNDELPADEQDVNIGLSGEPLIISLSPGFVEEVAIYSSVPAGTYDGLRFEVYQPVGDHNVMDSDFVTGRDDEQSYSAVIRGTVAGQPFELKIDSFFEQELEFSTPIVVDSDEPVDVDVIVDVAKWFVDSDGTQLDPRDASHRDRIKKAINRSFRHGHRRNPRLQELVGICHFPRHEGPVTTDFVLLNTLNPKVCVNEEGTPSEVTRFACRNEHRAIERFEGFNCKTENLE